MAEDRYVSLCRQHRLIKAVEPLSLEDVRAAIPEGGALLLPVLTPLEAFAFVLTAGPNPIQVVELPRLNSELVRVHLSGAEGWAGAYHERWGEPDDVADAAKTLRKAEKRWRDQLAATRAWVFL